MAQVTYIILVFQVNVACNLVKLSISAVAVKGRLHARVKTGAWRKNMVCESDLTLFKTSEDVLHVSCPSNKRPDFPESV